LARFNSDGSADTSFGPDGNGGFRGYVTGTVQYPSRIAFQGSDTLVLTAGGTYARVLSDGTPDPAFSDPGAPPYLWDSQMAQRLGLFFDSDLGSSSVFGLTSAVGPTGAVISVGGFAAFQADDQEIIVPEGYVNNGSGWTSLGLDRFLPDYPQRGTVRSLYTGAVAVRPSDGTIMLAGNGFFAWIPPNGIVSPANVRTLDINCWGAMLAIQPDGKVVVAGSGVERLNPDFTPDTTFGDLDSSTGQRTGHESLPFDISAMAVQPDGKIVLGGGDDLGILVARLNDDGSLDSGFGANGVYRSTFLGQIAYHAGPAIALQNDGKIVVAGVAFNQAEDHWFFAVERLLGDPSLQEMVNGPLPIDSVTGNPTLTLEETTQASADALISQFSAGSTLQPPPQATSPIDIVVTLGPGVTFNEATLVIPAGFRLQINGGEWHGGSPALTLVSGSLLVRNATFLNNTNAPTILVQGGSLTLRNDIVQESTAFNTAAIKVTGGSVDLGTAASRGGNTLAINGAGEFVAGAGPNLATTVGNTFQINGVTLPIDEIYDLILQVATLDLNNSQSSGLTSTLQAAEQSLLRDNNTAAVNQLNAFLHQVRALVNSHRLGQVSADTLVGEVDDLFAVLP
jgi:uncharacterized delta-60 repeat protein